MIAPALYKSKGRKLIKNKSKKKKRVKIVCRTIIVPPLWNRTLSLKFKTTPSNKLSPFLSKLLIKLRRSWWLRCRQGKMLEKKCDFSFKYRSTYLKRLLRKCRKRTAQMNYRNHKPLSIWSLPLVKHWLISVANCLKLRMRQERRLVSLRFRIRNNRITSS